MVVFREKKSIEGQRARGPDGRSGYVFKSLYSKNVAPKVELRQVSRTRAVEVVLVFM